MRVPSFWLATAGSFEDGGLGRGCSEGGVWVALLQLQLSAVGDLICVLKTRGGWAFCVFYFSLFWNLHVDLLFQLPAVGVVTSLRRWVALPRSLQA